MLTPSQRTNVERVKKAHSITIHINDGEPLTLVLKGDLTKVRHDIALAIQEHCNKENIVSSHLTR